MVSKGRELGMSSIEKLVSGTLVTHAGVFPKTSVAIGEGRVQAVGSRSAFAADLPEEDFGEHLLLPGVVDTHVHSLGVAAEGHWHSTCAAAAGGVTTINDHPLDLGGAPASPDEIDRKHRRTQPEAVVDFALLAAGLPERLDDIGASAEIGVTGFKMLMHTTSGAHAYGMRAVDDGELFLMFERIAACDQLGMVHAENEWVINALVARSVKEGKTYLAAHHETRPEFTEVIAAMTAIEMARTLGMRLHIVHTTVPKIFDLVAQARSDGVRVTAETCPHYLVCNQDRWQEVGSHYKINPPLRSEQSRLALWDQVRMGNVHAIGSDHAPHPGVGNPNVFETPSGSPGIETMLPLVFSEGVATGRIALPRLAELLSYNPARLLGLYPQKGALEAGSDADIVVFDPHARWTVRGAELQTQAKWSMYEGLEVTGAVRTTYVRGHKVFEDGAVIGKKGYGQWIRRRHRYDV